MEQLLHKKISASLVASNHDGYVPLERGRGRCQGCRERQRSHWKGARASDRRRESPDPRGYLWPVEFLDELGDSLFWSLNQVLSLHHPQTNDSSTTNTLLDRRAPLRYEMGHQGADGLVGHVVKVSNTLSRWKHWFQDDNLNQPSVVVCNPMERPTLALSTCAATRSSITCRSPSLPMSRGSRKYGTRLWSNRGRLDSFGNWNKCWGSRRSASRQWVGRSRDRLSSIRI